jgi:hypothetical protein
MNGLRTIGHTTQGAASISEKAQGSAVVGKTGEGAIATGHEAYGMATIDDGTLWTAAAGHIAQWSVGCWEAGAGDEGRSRNKARSLAESGNIVSSGRVARCFHVVGLPVSWLTASWFSASLLAVVCDPGTILTATGQAEDIAIAHICRAEGNGRGERKMARIAERS